MHKLIMGLAATLRPGGTLLVVGHSITDHRPFPTEFFYAGDELAAVLPDGWGIVSSIDREHPDREGLDVVLNARRSA
jgi:hypothetical protein